MYVKTVLLLVAFLAGINLSTAIKCYVCAGSASSDCAKGKVSAMSVVNCKAPGNGHSHHRMYSYFNRHSSSDESLSDGEIQPVCLKLDESDYVPRLLVRGCGMFPSNIDPCSYLIQHAHIVNCESCKTDLCNQKVEFINEEETVFNYIED